MGTNTYRVRLSTRKKPITIHADYFKIDEYGVITFRNVADPATTGHPYPKFVACFAAGCWSMVTNAAEEKK